MATLTDQPPRKLKESTQEDLEDFIRIVKDISSRTNLSENQVLKAYEILELKRRNDLYVANGDIKDEQLAGFGKIAEEINGSIKWLADVIQDR
jgi:type IV secretory pathway TrbF-like protein